MTRIEDFGRTPAERFRDYQKECKRLPRPAQARFWLTTLEEDPEVGRFTGAARSIESNRRRRTWNRVRRK